MNAVLSSRTWENIQVRPCTQFTGAEIAGLDLSQPLAPKVFAEIQGALHEYGVIFFRDQVLTEVQQLDFSRRFGNLETHVLTQFTRPEHPEILVLSNIVQDGKPIGLADAGHHWHSDTSYRREPDLGSILYAREIPVPNADGQSAGDTMFASAQAAYDALDEETKDRLVGLNAVFSYVNYYDSKIREGSDRPPLTEEQRRKVPDTVHPVVRTHPVTGRRSIYVNPGHTLRILDMGDDESSALLNRLYAHVIQDRFVYRHKWRVGDLLMWDNCCVQHNAIADYALPQRRLMNRTTIKGTVPV